MIPQNNHENVIKRDMINDQSGVSDYFWGVSSQYMYLIFLKIVIQVCTLYVHWRIAIQSLQVDLN